MALFSKKEKSVPEPQYYTSATNEQTYNYNVYYMSVKEKILYFSLAFFVGGIVGYLFFGGLAKDNYGNATTMTYVLNAIVFCVLGVIAGKAFLPMRTSQIIEKKRKMLNSQFRDMLEGLTTAIGAGKNIPDAFASVRDDLTNQYNDDAFILSEVNTILNGLQNNINIEDLLLDFGKRSGINEIDNFANVFKVCYRKGGNIKDVIRNTHEILSDKMEINEEVLTTISSSKLNLNIMTIMPVFMIAAIKMMSPDFAKNFATPAGIAATIVAVVIFVLAYFIGKKIMVIKL